MKLKKKEKEQLCKSIKIGLIRALYSRQKITQAQFQILMEHNHR